jgi:Flp pilus assembly pilin Flp
MGFWAKLTGWAADESAASMVEYALLVVFIAIVAFVAIAIAGRQVSTAFSTIAGSLSSN